MEAVKPLSGIQIRILKALDLYEMPIRSHDLANREMLTETFAQIEDAMHAAWTRGLVDKVRNSCGCQWSISALGKLALAASQHPPEPPANPVEPPAQSAAPASVAQVCIAEDELDNWWAGLDVEAKADTFIGFSLRAQGQDDSHIDVTWQPPIPVIGTIGETNKQAAQQ